ncbi:MAG: ABC transporter ATP-binding protein [Vicinamibacterales bacterium]|jgi:iron complex transport system ATP-binding protein|nr:ABC transporter ATP-binding protein [Vicinamibacterales bacterium]
MLVVRDLHFSYGSLPVLNGVSLSAKAGEVCGLFGPNGCGKTTLFRCCLGLLEATANTLAVDGCAVASLLPAQRARLMAYVPQEHKPPFPLLVRDVVMLGRTPYLGLLGRATAVDRRVVHDTIAWIGLTGLADRPYDRLSGGQRQLVLIARAVAQQTPIILLDEPASGLDFHNQILIWQVLQTLAASGTAVLCCSHDPNHVVWFCDRVVVMQAGCVVAEGPPAGALGASTLQRLYPDLCERAVADGAPVVLPAGVTARHGSARI